MENFELDWLKRWNLYSPEGIALHDADSGRRVTYSQLFQAATAAAGELKKRYHLQKGDRVAVLSLNEIEYVTLYFALQRLGAILVPVNYRLTSSEVLHILEDSSARVLIYQNEFYRIVEGLPSEKRPSVLLPMNGADSFELFCQSTATHSEFLAQAEDPSMIIYTSGTTGAPKGAILTLRMIFWNSINTTLRLNLSQSDAAVIFLPFFHTGGWHVLTTPFLHRGAKIILLKKFEPDRILELCESEKCTLLFGVPTTMEMMARSKMFAKSNLKSLRYAIVGGEPMPLEAIQTWHQKGVPIRQGYGLTEFGPNVFSLNEADAIRKIGSIGFPNFYIEAKIVDDGGFDVGAEQIGELVLRGPMAMTGYWLNEKATLETLRDGWLHTGDLVRRDDDGYYYVVGRKKDMFKSGGENVYPAELERVLRACPGVREAAVIGVPDPKWGEVGRAFIVKEDRSLDEARLNAHCSQNLAKFKIPKSFVFLEELPKGDSGKILKKALKNL